MHLANPPLPSISLFYPWTRRVPPLLLTSTQSEGGGGVVSQSTGRVQATFNKWALRLKARSIK